MFGVSVSFGETARTCALSLLAVMMTKVIEPLWPGVDLRAIGLIYSGGSISGDASWLSTSIAA
eukprot:387002-Pyramimonas_sp.AAC.1